MDAEPETPVPMRPTGAMAGSAERIRWPSTSTATCSRLRCSTSANRLGGLKVATDPRSTTRSGRMRPSDRPLPLMRSVWKLPLSWMSNAIRTSVSAGHLGEATVQRTAYSPSHSDGSGV